MIQVISAGSSVRDGCTNKINLKVVSVEALQKAHSIYVEQCVRIIYTQLTVEEQEHVDQCFNVWLADQPYAIKRLGLEQIYKSIFIARSFMKSEELEFEQWARARGHAVEKTGAGYQLK